MKAVELAKRVYSRRKKYFENLDRYLEIIKERAVEILPDSRLYLFGSVVEGKIHPLSDIDIAIVSDSIPERADDRARIKIEILREFDFSPFEIHLLSEREWEFYKRFIRHFREIL